MKLMIVESPNKVKKIKSILNDGRSGWEVAASVGHIRDLPLKTLGITMPAYVPEYELTERGRDVIKRLKALAAKADQVYLATDPDREGEAIAWHLKEALRLRSYQRVAFDAITPSVVARALERPRQIDDNLVHAQEARRVLDRLVGYQVSPVLSQQTGRRGLSAGRVQSPAVRLVVDREREIAGFKETKHFGAEVSFDRNSWRAQWETAPFLPKGEKYLMDEALATRAAACRIFRVDASENKAASQPPPPPFTTSTLLQAGSVVLGLKPDVTAQIAQKLFEAGLITYHRTDSQNLSAEALKEVRGYAAKRGLPVPAAARHWKARGGAQEAHEAIRPTHWPDEQAGDDRLQQAVYRLIWTRAVASQLADAEYSVNTLRLVAEGEDGAGPKGRRFVFKAVGRTLVAPGWKALTAKDDANEDEPARDGSEGENCGRVPLLAAGSQARAESGRVLYKQTRPPSRYTQASLIKKLESIGIGRPSTYPAILKNVMARGYLGETGKFLEPTDLGCLVVDTLEPRFRFLDYAFTRDLEQQLDDIAEGKAAYREVVAGADALLQQELGKLRGGADAPRAGGPVAATPIGSRASSGGGPTQASEDRPLTLTQRKRTVRQGTAAAAEKATSQRRVGQEQGIPAAGVEAASEKKRTAGAKKQTAATAGTQRTATATKRTAGAKKQTAATAGTQRTATATKRAPTAKKRPAQTTSAPHRQPADDQPPSTPICPVCRAGLLRLSRDEKFYGCSRYREGCGFAVNAIIAGRKTRPADLLALSSEGHTPKLSGFISKAGRPFEASLAVSQSGRVEFVFLPR